MPGAAANVTRPLYDQRLNQTTLAGVTALAYDARVNLTSAGGSAFSYG